LLLLLQSFLAEFSAAYRLCAGGLKKIKKNNNNNHDNVYGAVIMTKVVARVNPVDLMNAE